MNIVVVTRNMGAGGAERVIVQLLKTWSEVGVSCHLICMHPEKKFYSLPNDICVYDVPYFSENHNVDKILKYKHLREVVEKISPDVVLALPEEIGIYVLLAMLGTRVPVVVSERNNPWVMPYKKITRLLRQLLYPSAAGLIFQTTYAASFFSEKQRKKGIVLPNPLDISRIPNPYIGVRDKVVVAAGRLEEQKNFKLLIDSFSLFHKKHPDYRLNIYGEGSLRNELEKYATERIATSAFSFCGNVSDLLKRMNRCSMFVLCSDYEGMPNVLIEAMAMGMPVITTDYRPGGASTLIHNGENGIIVPVGNVNDLSEAMRKISDDSEFAVSIGNDAIKIRNKMDSKVVSEKWLNYLKHLCR